MEEHSRIKFNPRSWEFEIEGSEAFVKKYFVKIQEMISQTEDREAARRSAPPRKDKVRPAKTEKGRRKSNVRMVLDLIAESRKGISTTALKEKTGLSDRQIWGVIYRAEKAGKVRKAARGMYAAA